MPNEGYLLETKDNPFFFIDVGGKGRGQVLFAHGTAAWSGLWHPMLEAVETEGFRSTAFDMPPFGWSAHPLIRTIRALGRPSE